MFGNHIYLYDGVGKQFICYSLENNKKVFAIDKYGYGPGEYVSFTDFLINPYTNGFEILDNQSGKILRYDMNGRFISEHKTAFSGHYIEVLDSDHYVVFTNHIRQDNDENYNILILYTIIR